MRDLADIADAQWEQKTARAKVFMGWVGEEERKAEVVRVREAAA